MSKTSKVTAFLLMLAVAACASRQPPTSMVKVPDNLQPGANESLAMIVSAKGVQIYECRARKDQVGGYEWAFVAPEADLFDARGNRIGRHYAGPTWETADGSRVVGEVMQRSPVQGAIPWLLLRAKSNEGAGVFASAKYIQRVDTIGGVAPSAGCDATHAGAEARVDYSANYDFYGAKL